MVDWEQDAKKALATFRAWFGRASADPSFLELIEELNRLSPEFHQWWPRHDVRSHGEGVKKIQHPKVGLMLLEYTAFIVESEPDLNLVVYTPAPGSERAGINSSIEAQNVGGRFASAEFFCFPIPAKGLVFVSAHAADHVQRPQIVFIVGLGQLHRALRTPLIRQMFKKQPRRSDLAKAQQLLGALQIGRL